MRRVSIVVAAVLVMTATARLSAQEPVKPGPEHEHLKQLEGVWDATVHEQNGESKGTMSWKMGLGGLWRLEHFKGEFGGAPFEGHGGTTYDPAKKKYVSVWIDSMSTTPLITEGTYDKAKKTMTLVGSTAGPDGKMMKVTMTSRMIDADNVAFTMTGPMPDGKEFEFMKIAFKRRAK